MIVCSLSVLIGFIDHTDLQSEPGHERPPEKSQPRRRRQRARGAQRHRRRRGGAALQPRAGGDRGGRDPARPRRGVEPHGRFEPVAEASASTTAGQSTRSRAPFKTEVTVEQPRTHHHPQRLARHRLRPVDQSLSRLRARLHLLLRAADARLSRPLARARFRDQAVRQAERRRAAASASWPTPGYAPKPIALGAEHRPLPADRARATASRARCSRCWTATNHPGRHRHEVGAWSCATSTSWRRWPSRGLAKVAISVTTLDRAARAQDGAARRDARRSASTRSAALGEAGVPVTVMVAPIIPAHQRPRDRGASWRRPTRPARARPATCCCACRTSSRICCANGCRSTIPDKLQARVLAVCRTPAAASIYDSTWGKRQTGVGPYRLDDRPPLRARRPSARLQPRPPDAAHRPVHAAAREGAGQLSLF